ncbi:hypothetical protein B0T26DRAFT_359216 [Lasiosphaeria miniovina]|uniref:Uncharacterized protein n=1 Tax=Lasiosphaeria miniovina TaxID=1954250 RepID=A0AA40DTW5_9PEZI|nr:uncharacterized protein B0T26DRAFT_359216 [Lasiosphaeria miniovina]KAK0713211.1 hypothetical protein B0T26DRAFT_359216 [Lasiosphaeria miniovina]
MCTFDYTPYAGCVEGQQHFYLQWMKCNRAIAIQKYCSIERSIEMQTLRLLSGSIICCPIHNPISVEQHQFQVVHVNDEQDDEDESLSPLAASPKSYSSQRRRARTLTRPESATPKHDRSMLSFEDEVRAVSRRRKAAAAARNASPVDSRGSRESSPRPARPRTSGGERRARDHSAGTDWSAMPRGRSHRRVSSVDVAQPPARSKTFHGKPPPSFRQVEEKQTPAREEPRNMVPAQKSPRPVSAVGQPIGPGAGIGLPSSPDIHRRASMALRKPAEQDSAARQAGSGAASLASRGDSSPEDNWEPLPPRPLTNRGRSTPDLSPIQGRNEERAMRRIEEHRGPEEEGEQTAAGRGNNRLHRREGSDSSGRLKELLVPEQRPKHVRDVALTIKVPGGSEQSADALRQNRKSMRLDNRAAASLQKTEDTGRSRRYEDQVEEGRKWVAAREYMPITTMGSVVGTASPPQFHSPQQQQSESSLTSRESNDSGYLSGGNQRKGPGGTPTSPLAAGFERSATPSADAKSIRSVLQKAQPHRPPPLELSGLPPVALPVVLMPDQSAQPVTSPGKSSLLHRMGLRRKISGLLWERNSPNAVGDVRS